MKIIKISKALNITDEMKQSLFSLMPQIMEDSLMISKEEGEWWTVSERESRVISFLNPYDGSQMAVSIVIKQGGKGLSASCSSYSGDTEISLAIPTDSYEFDKKYNKTLIKAGPFTEKNIYDVLIHELSHAIDPKNKIYDLGTQYLIEDASPEEKARTYYTDKREIDAFQTEIVNSIVNSVKNNPSGLDKVNNWLRKSVNLDLASLQVNQNAIYAYNYWKKNSPDIIFMLRKRIHSALQNQT
jgi:hypothetical protein